MVEDSTTYMPEMRGRPIAPYPASALRAGVTRLSRVLSSTTKVRFSCTFAGGRAGKILEAPAGMLKRYRQIDHDFTCLVRIAVGRNNRGPHNIPLHLEASQPLGHFR
jgi:hypothetical protein